jgi:hypothetical protein
VAVRPQADGGLDTDTLHKTSNVTDTNVESVTIVP